MKRNPDDLYQFVYYRNIVKQFGYIIRDILLTDSNHAELIIDHYHLESDKKRYMPQELSAADKVHIIETYIDSESPHINYLRHIPHLKEIKLSGKTILKAKQRLKEEEEKLFGNSTGVSYSISLRFVENQEKEVLVTNDGLDYTYLYSLDWVKENKDYSTLLNNFIYLFGYVDNHMKVTFTLKKSQTGSLIELLTSSSKYTYNTNTTFDFDDRLSLLQLYSYYITLGELEIRLEDIVEWFYKSYLSEEFSLENFQVYLPSEGAAYREKCVYSFVEIESILKQYNLYTEDNEINHELLSLSSNSLDFKECSSLVEKKYIYFLEENARTISYLFFSDQCMLSYIPRLKDKYSTFYALICNESIVLDDYEGIREKNQLDWLIENNWLFISNGKIAIKDYRKLKILYNLHTNEVASYWNYSQIYRDIIDELLQEGLVTYESSLFSRPEQDYFSYNFNNKKFSNGLALRNKYGHGTNYKGNPNDISYFNDYLYALRLLILITIKINDDLCLYNSQDYIQYLKNSKQGEL